MPILPDFALFVILQSWSFVLQLVSAYWYERQLARYADHWLVQLDQIADLTPLEQACAGFHVGSGSGSSVTHAVPRLVRALLIKYLYHRSLRQTEELIDNHMLIKWFVGYGLFEAPPDHCTLNRFELWVFRTQPRLFFDEVIRLIDHLCPEDRQRLQIIDTFGLQARAAQTYLIELIRDLGRLMLTHLEQVDPDRHTALVAELDLTALFGAEDEKITAALKAPQRAERLQQVGQQALRLARLLNLSLDQAPCLPPDDQAPLRLWLAALSKVMADETTVTALDPADPDAVTIVERKHGDKGTYRLGAASDLDPTYRKHDDQPALLGYNPTVLGTSVFLRETHVATGAEPDNVPAPTILQNQFEHHGFFPDQLAGDMKYGYGKTRAQIAQVTNHQTQIIALIPNYEQRSDRFGPSHFTLSDDGLRLTCPHHLTTARRYLTEGKGGADFRFPATLCRDCPLWDQCRGPDSKKSVPRNVFISFYRDELQAAHEFNQTDPFKQGIKQRMHIERLIYCLTNIYGARKAQSYGLARTDYQLKMQATAFNLRQLVREVLKQRPPPGAESAPLAA
ncbi:MAG: transposase [Anaerolineae bacterium]|nr:transposase [Anaerolineae bacterium]